MGPHRIRQVAKWLGRVTVQLQTISRGFARQLNAELDAIDEGGELKGAMQDIQDLRQQIKDLRKEIITTTAVPREETERIVRETQEALHSIKPPHIGTQKQPNGRKEESTTELTPPNPVQLPNVIDIPDDPEV